MEVKQLTASERIRGSRKRLNILKESEFQTIEYLCERMPQWVSPDMLTAVGILGSMVIAIGLVLSQIYSAYFISLSIFGFALNWFGDSLDGRIAYYRNTPRKWYGWALDINADWISIGIIGMGFYFYFPIYKALAFIFVLAYGGSMILSLLGYKLNDKYIIDKGQLGPTELRIIVCLVLIVEMFLPGALIVFAGVASVALIMLNIKETKEILKSGDLRDKFEKIKKQNQVLETSY